MAKVPKEWNAKYLNGKPVQTSTSASGVKRNQAKKQDGSLQSRQRAKLDEQRRSKPIGTGGGGVSKPVGGASAKPAAKPPAPGRGGNTGTVRATGDTSKFPWMEKYKPTDLSPQQKKNVAKVQQGLRGAAAVAGGARGLGIAAVASAVAPRAANANEAAEIKKAHAKQNKANAEYRKKNYTPDAKGFDNAFRDARRAGSKTFTWEGKKYTTEKK
jgi:hypothetical protein